MKHFQSREKAGDRPDYATAGEMFLRPGEMKILRAIHSAHPHSGGPINGIAQITPLLEERGISTSLISLDSPDDPFWQEFSVDGVGVGPGVGFYGFTYALNRALQERLCGVDLVIIHGLWQYHSIAVARSCWRRGIPYVVYPHGMLDPWFKRRYPWKHLKKWCYWPWADYRVLRNAQAVLFTTERERDLARQTFGLYRANEAVIAYGTRTAPDLDQSRFRSNRYLLYLGRIHSKKGIEILLNAYRAWTPLEKPRLLVAGPVESAYAQRIKQSKVEGVEWVGSLSSQIKYHVLRDAEALILPSHQENFGLVVAEALSVGTPVLTTHGVNTSADLIKDGAGFAENDDVAGVLRMLRRWEAMGTNEREVMRARAKESFEKRYDLSRCADTVSRLLFQWAGVDS